MKKLVAKGAASLALLSLSALPVLAQDAEAAPAVTPEVAYIFNTLLFLIGGFLVMWMAAGFAMLEAGLVRSKNVSMQCLKNISLYSIAGLMFWITGYNLMYTGVDGGFMGSFGPYSFDPVGGDALDTGYSTASDWFFQMVFVATAASIVSGTLAERIKLWPFLIFTVVLTGFIYPIAGSWQWGAGWLSEMGFSDFAGSTLVHSVGGWAALAGAIILGARKGKYGTDGAVHPMPGSSMPLATLGTFILWLGWFGFNGASQLAMGSIGDVTDISRIFANTNMAAAAGVVAAVILTQVMYKKVDVTMALNGALAGLVSITAEPLAPSVWQAVFIGAIGGVIVVFTVPLLDKLKIDDVVGAIPVHLIAGIWGTLIVPLSNDGASYGTQIVGIVSYGVFTLVASGIVWFILKAAMGIRVSEEEEALGLDKVEIGVEAYPEFGTGSQRM
ncbi:MULTISPECIES: ammonium transporter [Stappiaceae]|jgi:Amt family ammonium transporter|uniref:ammonium transporter n=1 Tax=Stappiaceae TaxID=2821832 RepID=UPI001063F392|nr:MULTISPECIES: ammonium transporter [Stappiaceae]MBO9421521.1 ammonium transporter [Labrenzia sp. R4_2]MBO9427297.1 ammonium transporter [Labrenzia sp. R4_1]